MPQETLFATYPSAVVFKDRDRKKPVQHLIWGDWVEITGPMVDGWIPVIGRRTPGWMPQKSLQKDRLLELVFVDIGQGDGCLLVTPEDQRILVDAGQSDNMLRFLRWMYGDFGQPFEAAVISHPDRDHYGGFQALLRQKNLRIGTVYHNGLMERGGGLGPEAREGPLTFCTGIIADRAGLEGMFVPNAGGPGMLARLLRRALGDGHVGDCRMLCSADGHLPGYEAGKALSVQVLAPVVEPDGNGTRRLRRFDRGTSIGKTKNGHSIVLRVRYRDVSILLGGDLNVPAELFLLRSHTGQEIPENPSAEERAQVVDSARRIFGTDITKACHHGSADFSEIFLESVSPVATIISSGDNEPHAHPRADSLGAVGRWSRGDRPLIFSTELARSAPERIKHPEVVRKRIQKARHNIEAAGTEVERLAAEKEFAELLKVNIGRSIAVFGAINVRTDGHRVVFAYKIESPLRKDREWDIYKLEPRDGHLRLAD